MRFAIMVKGNTDTEAGMAPDEKLFAAMADYHEALVKAGVLLDASGLQPSSKGARIAYSGGSARSSTARSRRPRSSSPATRSFRSSRGKRRSSG